MHLPMFSGVGEGGGAAGGGFPRELDSFENVGSHELPIHLIQFCVKNPLEVPSDLDTISRSHACAKVVCQILKGSDCFDCLIPRVCPIPLWGGGENIDRRISQHNSAVCLH